MCADVSHLVPPQAFHQVELQVILEVEDRATPRTVLWGLY